MKPTFVASLFTAASGAQLARAAARRASCARRARAPVRMNTTRPPQMSEAEAAAGARGEPTMVRARHILVDTEEMVDALRAQVDEGTPFDKLAETVSTCPSKTKGGDLGWFKRHMMVPEFEQAVFKNSPGSLVKVQTQFGWHLVRVEQHGLASGQISVQELGERFPDGFGGTDVQFVDCREQAELDLAKLEGFLNLPMGEYGTWADQFDSGELGFDKTKETVVMCHHGLRSSNFCQFLSQQGFENVRNLVGGIDAYSRLIDDSVPRY